MVLGVIGQSKEPYYYIDDLNGRVKESSIKMNLTSIVNVTFVYNVAPNFSVPLTNVNLTVNSTLIIDLPIIVDPDSPSAYI